MYILTKKKGDVLLPMIVKRDGSFCLCWSRSLFKLQERYADVTDKIVIEVPLREDFDNISRTVEELNSLAQDYAELEDGAFGVLKEPIQIHPMYGEPSFRWDGYHSQHCDCCDCAH